MVDLNTRCLYIIFEKHGETNGEILPITEENTSLYDVYKQLSMKGKDNKISTFYYLFHQEQLHIIVEYEKKFHIRSQGFFTVYSLNSIFVPKIIRSTKCIHYTPNEKLEMQEYHLDKIYYLKHFLKALTDRDDLDMVSVLKEEPIYISYLRPMNLSVFYVISHIVCSMYVEQEYQELRMQNTAKKILELPYIYADSEKKIKECAEGLNRIQLKQIFQILKGNM